VLNPVSVTVVGYQDKFTPDERVAKAKRDQHRCSGRRSTSATRTSDRRTELATIDVDALEVEAEVKSLPEQEVEQPVAMPGEKIANAKTICGATGVIGPAPCEREPDHAQRSHESSTASGRWREGRPHR
jgi:hypothetical protein